MKNPYQQSGSSLYIQLTNTPHPTFLTASISDKDTIEAHRWRWHNGSAVAVVEENGQHVTATLDSILMDVNREVAVVHRDGNPYNYSRPNLGYFNSKIRNQYIDMGNGVTY